MSPRTIVPPILYFPVVPGADPTQQQFVVRRLTDGRDGLLAYTALDRLATNCGDDQPWVLLPIEQLERIKQAQPFDVVAFDLVVPPDQRRGKRIA
ncbi:SAV_915 family protein [Leucobacter japonicus]|uniref:SAV_915 family protein n=1 Tax=Leucobacter japonicus TaxID=1461259 RepID=UPI0006A7EEB1|nr:SAV_915 family protein [Leucobacter japonicus]